MPITYHNYNSWKFLLFQDPMGCPGTRGEVEVGYVQTIYTINENEGQVEVCLFANFTSVDLNIMILVEAFDFNHSMYIPSGAALASECDTMLGT